MKRIYNQSPKPFRLGLVIGVGALLMAHRATVRLLHGQNPIPYREWRGRKETRGRSFWHDLVDWVGGYPFEVAKPKQVFDFCRERGLALQRLKTRASGLETTSSGFLTIIDHDKEGLLVDEITEQVK